MSVSDRLPTATGHRRALCFSRLRTHAYLYTLFCLAGDVGGQRTLRPYWRNYFERTDAVVWVVDSGDRDRMKDCREELWGLLGEEVSRLCWSGLVCSGLIGEPRERTHGMRRWESAMRAGASGAEVFY